MLYDKKWDKEVKVVDEVGQVMLKAADYIEEHGLARGFIYRENGPQCTMRAIYEQCEHNDDIYRDSAMRIARHLGLMIDRQNSPGFVGSWNDNPKVTKQEVVNLLRELAYQ